MYGYQNDQCGALNIKGVKIFWQKNRALPKRDPQLDGNLVVVGIKRILYALHAYTDAPQKSVHFQDKHAVCKLI